MKKNYKFFTTMEFVDKIVDRILLSAMNLIEVIFNEGTQMFTVIINGTRSDFIDLIKDIDENVMAA